MSNNLVHLWTPGKVAKQDIIVSKMVSPLPADLGEGALSDKGKHTQPQLHWNNVHILLHPPRPLIHLDVLPHRCCSPTSTSRPSPPSSPPSSLPSPSATFASCLSPPSPLARPPWEERKNVLRYLVVLTATQLAPFSTDTKKQRPNKNFFFHDIVPLGDSLVGSNKRPRAVIEYWDLYLV